MHTDVTILIIYLQSEAMLLIVGFMFRTLVYPPTRFGYSLFQNVICHFHHISINFFIIFLEKWCKNIKYLSLLGFLGFINIQFLATLLHIYIAFTCAVFCIPTRTHVVLSSDLRYILFLLNFILLFCLILATVLFLFLLFSI